METKKTTAIAKIFALLALTAILLCIFTATAATAAAGPSAGHMAVVEAINGNKVTISESYWKGTNFQTRTINSDGSDYLTAKGFLGYIYIQ